MTNVNICSIELLKMATQLFSWKLSFCLFGLLLYSLYYYEIPHQKVIFGLKWVMNANISTNGSYLAEPIQTDYGMDKFKIRPPSYASYKTKTNCSCVNLNKNITEMNCIKNATIMSNRTIYIKTMGRLGNVLFQISSAYAIAKDTNSQLAVVDSEHLKALESRPFKTITLKQWDNPKVKLVHGAHKLIDFERAFNTALTSSVKLIHSLQRYIFFGRCENEIRQKLALKSSAIKKAESAILNLIKNHKNWTSNSSTTATTNKSSFNSTDFVTVGIHIRRGDLTSRFWFTDGYRFPSLSYFTNAMNYFRSKYSKVIFVIATDGKPWVQQHLLQSGVYLSPLISPAEDMALISRCDHAIISLGTFSWWAGFYNRGTVIYFKDWIAPNSNIWKRVEYSEKERFPPYWLPMI